MTNSGQQDIRAPDAGGGNFAAGGGGGVIHT